MKKDVHGQKIMKTNAARKINTQHTEVCSEMAIDQS